MNSLKTRVTKEDEFYSKAALAMAKAIDQEIVETLEIESLLKQGWIDSRLQRPIGWLTTGDWCIHTSEWCHTHCTGDYKYCSGRWFFVNSQDCTAFLLKWA